MAHELVGVRRSSVNSTVELNRYAVGKVSLYYTKVTDAGVANLQKALPNCKIAK